MAPADSTDRILSRAGRRRRRRGRRRPEYQATPVHIARQLATSAEQKRARKAERLLRELPGGDRGEVE